MALEELIWSLSDLDHNLHAFLIQPNIRIMWKTITHDSMALEQLIWTVNDLDDKYISSMA
jgi:hypothetical protein